MSLAAALEENSRLVEEELDRLLPPVIMSQGRLHDAMRYAVLGGGKRLRAFLVNETGSLLGAGSAACLRVAAALEMMHAYSLIHDDLPAMDDAAIRRGRTSCHLAFDEATAILAGDALQALAYDVIATASSPVPAAARAPIVAELARASGALGMCGGQMLDLQGEVDPQDLDGVMLTQRMKTGALFEFACSAACHLSERGMAARPDLREFARCFGLAFQIRDDILDETGDEAAMGKDLGRDAASNKSTMVSHLGIDGANGRLAALRAEAGAALDRLPGDVSLLRALMDASISRTS